MTRAKVGGGAGPDAAVVEQAVAWLVTLWSGDAGQEERAACERWRRADPTHEAAWQHVQALDRHFSTLPPELAGPALRGGARLRQRRRALRYTLMLAGGAGVLALAAREGAPWFRQGTEYRVATSESRAIVLDDGSRVAMNTATELEVRFTALERRLVLRAGEVFIATHPEARPSPRPFLVETPRGTVQALGTRFLVRESRSHSRVAVYEGAVAIQPSRAVRPTRLDAGRQASFTSDVVADATAANPDAYAWTHGQLIVERMRLGDFLKELGRYRAGWVRCDPAVRNLLVSGVFPLPDTTRVLNALEHSLPVRVHYWSRYWVSVVPA
ncbi:hypothetical protein CAL29_27970 [Bordetella genomosp. 10]|uniref:Iron dicitrate transport regulator FecR n=1 Tax=Bordetella genomosp. 10 TaxID=1416804 RepID=A0A261S2X9_9BORD|nr:FecR family protein [Bordetella genomosp. 10]OZI31714.1 hypothetical protein CAL29_27970 [Bordetella genomosp. 10]